MNNGIVVSGKGSIGVAKVISGERNNVTSQNDNVTLIENIDITENIESFKYLLDELKSELSEQKSFLDKLSTELEEKNPNKEKITKHLKDSLSTVHQATGTINNLHNILKIFQSLIQ